MALYGIAAAVEIAGSSSPAASALIEEGLKAALLLGAAVLGLRVSRGRAVERPSLRRERLLRLAAARHLSLGLVAIAAFAGAENIAYFAAFPEAGVLGRFLWSMPVHLVAALVEALGLLPFVALRAERIARPLGGPQGALRPLKAGALWCASLAAAASWHLAANTLVSSGQLPEIFPVGAAVNLALLALLMGGYLNRAYIGGFLHGSD
jgi:hypothetical protein